MVASFETLRTELADGVLTATLDAPPINMIGPELVRDLVTLLRRLTGTTEVRVVVFDSADPDFFISHVDLTRVAEYSAEAAKAGGGPQDAFLGIVLRKLSDVPAVTIAKLRGRARGAGSEFVLACDMCFAARENALLGQPECGFGVAPGAGGVQHLARRLGRGRALEMILGAQDADADLAERYGWINRALPDAELDEFVATLARRIASFPPAAIQATKRAINELTLPTVDAVRADGRRFQESVAAPEVQDRSRELFSRGFQTRGPLELDLGTRIADLPANG
ncbi:enoyl-CoA hydratase/isomerase family protein [Micromonospora sp. WMMD812]|uniref:enoyl-CoA hydratase/isomerase family protein n=1 Tax=Micromonospora sp. WMMD812 TaxID=3015152 RepID=UPI00248A92B2|nr:enoyl-CoA hydratase/isomerase family protein [Micromonospora sp. WMMD812]WBB65402.1 enoyl-CoA hydratase/isomerase family protein [Micromonospora sp. WMMD812]